MSSYPGKQKYFMLLSRLWDPNEGTRKWAIHQLLKFGDDAVGPLSRRLADHCESVAKAALRTLDELGAAEGPRYYWKCRTAPTLRYFADFGAFLTNQFSDAEGVNLQQAAILAGISGLTFYVPNICGAWIRNRHHYAGRALSEALYHLRCSNLMPTFRQLACCGDRLTQELSLFALADLNDTSGVKVALDQAEKNGWTKSRGDCFTLQLFRDWLAGIGPIPRWSDEIRWPSHADSLVCRLAATSGLDLLEWEPADLPSAAEYEGLLEQPPHFPGTPVQLWCDASWYEPRRAGWAAIAVLSEGPTVEWSGALQTESSTEAELEAALRGLRKLLPVLKEASRITIVTDFATLAEGMNYRANRWSRTGWFNSRANTVVGSKIWQELLSVADEYKEQGHGLSWRWTPGHAGIPLNEKVDQLSREACNSGKSSSPHAG